MDSWTPTRPGGIRQQFRAAQPLVEGLLRRLKLLEGLQGPLDGQTWDQGDACAAYVGANLAAVVFPTAAVMDKLRALAEGGSAPKLLLIINPQWRLTTGATAGRAAA